MSDYHEMYKNLKKATGQYELSKEELLEQVIQIIKNRVVNLESKIKEF